MRKKDAQNAAPPERERGRPRGRSAQGIATRNRLYTTAVRLIAARGWDETTLRAVAAEAGVSVGLLYRYFPSKRAIVLALYDEVSAQYATQAAAMESGRWRKRFLYALRTSLDVLRPHRRTLVALVPVLVGAGEDGLFAPATAFSRHRVERVFQDAVLGATDAPPPPLGPALGRLLYLVHLATILFWLLDKSPGQAATDDLVLLLDRALPLAALSLRLRRVGALIVAADDVVGKALFNDSEGQEEHQR